MMAKKKILIAEDEKPLAKAMQLKLGKLGFDVQIAGDGQEALDILKKEKFDLLILDLIMPKVDGFGVLEGIKKNKIKVKIIVSSNLSQDEDFKKAKKMGAVDYFIKSDTPISDLINQIARNIN